MGSGSLQTKIRSICEATAQSIHLNSFLTCKKGCKLVFYVVNRTTGIMEKKSINFVHGAVQICQKHGNG
jgi:hypothetical protein